MQITNATCEKEYPEQLLLRTLCGYESDDTVSRRRLDMPERILTNCIYNGSLSEGVTERRIHTSCRQQGVRTQSTLRKIVVNAHTAYRHKGKYSIRRQYLRHVIVVRTH